MPRRSGQRTGALSPGVVTKTSQLTLHDKMTMLEYYDANNRNQSATARYFRGHGFPQLAQGTVSRIVRDEQLLRTLAKSPDKLTTIKSPDTRHPLFDKALSFWEFKAIYCKMLLPTIIDDLHEGNIGSNPFKINQKAVMSLAILAWEAVREKTVVKC
ncbi:hypothetical protein ACHHYP_16355 [Achlya hypogyna]|uniref:Uncharacterized protein n=1 Tax=Achlya hypogyna TaxID=1202772 RepID=A0A1V9Y8Y8_ACHHY|nr:hypothetical protein ACHHYP_16355 [Achlya hypogyna]